MEWGAMGEGAPRILVVDDLDEHRDLLAQVLEDLGYQVSGAADGKAALAAIAEGAPVGLVLVDLRMPVMDGAEFLVHLRADPDAGRARTPVVVMTADPLAEDDWRAGMRPDQFLVKPFGLRELRQVVVRFCGKGSQPLRAGAGTAQSRE
jgi:CheY-like chemotaxis protein